MDEEGPQITVVGLVLIVAAVIAGVLLIRALGNAQFGGPQKDRMSTGKL